MSSPTIQPIPHFHGVFTLPEDLRAIARRYPREVYDALFRCVSATSGFVLKYLGRYTHRVGISNTRLLDVTAENVTFRTKDGRKVSLHPVTFLKRFVQHVLPDGFKKIRHAGLYAAPKALAQAKAKLEPLPAPVLSQPTWQEALLSLTGRDVAHCAGCGAKTYRRMIPMPPAFQRCPRSPP